MKQHLVAFGSVVLYVAGIAILLQLHTSEFYAKTYVSENALLIGEAETTFHRRHLQLASSFTKRYNRLSLAPPPQTNAIWLANELEALGIDAGVHSFSCPDKSRGETVVAIIRAPRTSGSEAIVLASRYSEPSSSAQLIANGDVVDGMGLSMALMSCLSDVQWLSKDVLLVLTPDRCGDAGISDWLDVYFNPSNVLERDRVSYSNDTFFRAGLIRGGFNFNFVANSMDYVTISLHGKNGALPNLDLINTIDRTVRFVEHKSVVLYTPETPFVQWLFSNFNDYISMSYEALGMFVFAAQQAIGLPTDDHGLFLEYNIESITLGVTSRNLDDGSVISLGRVAEMGVHSLSNLSENLHQSFYFYLLPVSHVYVSIGQYMIPLVLIVLGCFLSKAHTAVNADGHHFLEALMRLCVVSTQGVVLYVLCDRPLMELALLYVGSIVLIAPLLKIQQLFYRSLLRSFSDAGKSEAKAKAEDETAGTSTATCDTDINAVLQHSIAIVPMILFVALSALQNFSFCVITATLALPLFVLLAPTASRVLRALKLLLALATCPPVVILLLSHLLEWSPEHTWATLYQHHVHAYTLAVPFLTLVYAPIHTSISLVLCGC